MDECKPLCVGLSDVPEDDWFCQLCTDAGVTMRGAGVAVRANERANAHSAAAAASVPARAGSSAAAAAAAAAAATRAAATPARAASSAATTTATFAFAAAAAIPARAASSPPAAATTATAAAPFEHYASDVYMQSTPRIGIPTHAPDTVFVRFAAPPPVRRCRLTPF